MQAFEFHFNPLGKGKLSSNKKDIIFDSFCFEPQNAYEKRLGNLYLVGLLKNSLPQHNKFIQNLSEIIKKIYYKNSSLKPEKALKESLKAANNHLEEIAKKGDVSWLGNLSFVIISLFPRTKPWWNVELNLAKIGDFKVLLIRNSQIIDIDQRLKNIDDFEPYPLKIFSNIISGKLSEGDTIAVLSLEIYQAFSKEKVLKEIAEKAASKFVDIVNSKKKELVKASGICLLLSLDKEKKEKSKKTLEERKLKTFSFKEIFKNLKKKIKLKKSIPTFSPITASGISLPSFPSLKKSSKKTLKIILSVLILLLLLFLGFLIFNQEDKKNLEDYLLKIEQIENKIGKIEDEENIEKIYREAWKEVSSLEKAPLAAVEDFLQLENKIKEKLNQLNNLKEINEPELFFSFPKNTPVKEKIIALEDKVFLFSSNSKEIILIEKEKESKFSLNYQPNQAAVNIDSVLFFSEPNFINIFKKERLEQEIQLKDPIQAKDFFYYASNLYFLGKENNTIFKYPYISDSNWGNVQTWKIEECLLEEEAISLSCQKNTATDLKSMAVDSSIWILNQENVIEQYYSGVFQEKIFLDIFPEIKQLTKIYSSYQLPYLYLSEPEQKRIIVIDKSGKMIQQYQSEKFNNILDFTVDQKNKDIYLINETKVYRIKADI
jgi:hypothetical protein